MAATTKQIPLDVLAPFQAVAKAVEAATGQQVPVEIVLQRAGKDLAHVERGMIEDTKRVLAAMAGETPDTPGDPE